MTIRLGGCSAARVLQEAAVWLNTPRCSRHGPAKESIQGKEEEENWGITSILPNHSGFSVVSCW